MDDPNTANSQTKASNAFATASSSAHAGMDQVSDAASSAKSAAGEAAGEAKEQAVSVASQVKDKAVAAVTEQKQGLADQIDGLAQSVHKSGEHFAGQQDWIAGAIERGATELGALATSLRDNDLASLYGQVRSIAKQQPALFIGACLAGGFALARVGKLVAADVSRDDLPNMPEVGHGGQ